MGDPEMSKRYNNLGEQHNLLIGDAEEESEEDQVKIMVQEERPIAVIPIDEPHCSKTRVKHSDSNNNVGNESLLNPILECTEQASKD